MSRTSRSPSVSHRRRPALSQAENELRFAERALRNEQEKNAELSRRTDELSQAVIALGGDVNNLGPISGPNVNGVIVSRSTLPSGPHATISVGRQDDIRPGMEFAVYSSSGDDFLGLLTVTDVDDQQAFGRLRGPAVARISNNDRVRPADLR